MDGGDGGQAGASWAGWPLNRLADRVGQTPFYAYDRAAITRRVAEVRAILPEEVKLYYAVKANPMPALLAHLAPLVDGMDVASGGELRAALNAGCDPGQACFAGPGKRGSELAQAVAAGALIQVESEGEVHRLAEVCAVQGRAARVALRVNPDFEMRSAGMRMGGGPQAFGVDLEQAPEVLARIRACGLAFEGFHVYAGSQVLQADWLIRSWRHAIEMLMSLAPHLPGRVQTVNLGGGWGIPYFAQAGRLDTGPLHDALADVSARMKQAWPEAALVQELGRYLVGEAGIYVARVLERKVSRGQTFLVLDGGLHHHLAATGHLGQIIHRPYPMGVAHVAPGGQRTGDDEVVHVAGPLCTPLDSLGASVTLPRAEVGDLVVVFQSGAYGASASPQGFLSHPPCIEVLV
jgi:diaminopimelate decarboxylase